MLSSNNISAGLYPSHSGVIGDPKSAEADNDQHYNRRDEAINLCKCHSSTPDRGWRAVMYIAIPTVTLAGIPDAVPGSRKRPKPRHSA